MAGSPTADEGAVRLLNEAYLRMTEPGLPTASWEQSQETPASMLNGLRWLTEMSDDKASATIRALSPGAQLMIALLAVKELRDLGWSFRFAGGPAR
jgi:hypothetical protein